MQQEHHWLKFLDDEAFTDLIEGVDVEVGVRAKERSHPPEVEVEGCTDRAGMLPDGEEMYTAVEKSPPHCRRK
jgi:hypothetical protein